ncbi:LysR family transcriptional regulator [Leifsonia sp. YAF41]|uniref:LysR family transcriptional regulator n=1 Tax=Leifsonia sp. YAF41 TaxID=3233086 RepID=UPI003F948C43
METRKLDCFIAVARDLHFGRAAERLYMNQSTLSESIRSLEREIGGTLFERTSRRVALTPLGDALLREMEPALIALNGSLQEAQRRARGDKFELTVGYLGGGFYELNGPMVSEFERFRPDVKMLFLELSYLDQIAAISDGTVDVALVRLPVGLPDLRRGAILFQDPRMLAVPAGHRLAQSGLVDPEELQYERMVRLPPGAATPAWSAYHFPLATPSGAPIPAGPIIRTVREGLAAVEAGQGVMTMTWRAQNYFRQPGVTFVELDLPPIQSALVTRAADHRPILTDLENAARKAAARMGTLQPQGEDRVTA